MNDRVSTPGRDKRTHAFAQIAKAAARIDGAGHGVARDQPALFNALALEYLAQA